MNDYSNEQYLSLYKHVTQMFNCLRKYAFGTIEHPWYTFGIYIHTRPNVVLQDLDVDCFLIF